MLQHRFTDISRTTVFADHFSMSNCSASSGKRLRPRTLSPAATNVPKRCRNVAESDAADAEGIPSPGDAQIVSPAAQSLRESTVVFIRARAVLTERPSFQKEPSNSLSQQAIPPAQCHAACSLNVLHLPCPLMSACRIRAMEALFLLLGPSSSPPQRLPLCPPCQCQALQPLLLEWSAH